MFMGNTIIIMLAIVSIETDFACYKLGYSQTTSVMHKRCAMLHIYNIIYPFLTYNADLK